MYISPYNKNEDTADIKAFLHQNSFGILINSLNGKLWGTHIPMLMEEAENGQSYLHGHIAKANPQWQSFEEDTEVLAIFNGPHSYISSSWYGHENVPTWNYIAVHVYGKIKTINGQELMDSLKQLTDKYEAYSANPVRLETLSAKTLRQVKGIVGFKILITDIQAVYKLSQNRNMEDYHTIIEELNKTDEPGAKDIAKVMKERL